MRPATKSGHLKSSARVAALIVVLAIFLLVLSVPASAAQQCQISVAASPSTVNLPGPIPAGGLEFGVVFDLNYSASLANQTVILQYQNGTSWKFLQNITANSVGFTETTVGLSSSWAHEGQNEVRAVSGACSSDPIPISVTNDQSAVPLDVLAYVILFAVGAGFFLLGRWLGLGAFIAVAAVVYLAVTPFTGQRYDVYFLFSSGIRVLQHVNPFDPGNPALYPSPLKWAYPPLYVVYSAFSFLVYQGATGSALPSVSSLTWPGYLTSTYNVWLAYVPKTLPLLVSVLKVPMVLSAVGVALLLRKMTGKDSTAVAWLANPLVIFVAAVWGQLDPIATFLAVAAVYYYGKGKPYPAYLLASLGAAVKVWPILLIPIFLADSLRRDGMKAIRPLSAVLPAALGSAGLYALYGNLVQTLFVFVYARGIPTYHGEFTVNGLTWQQVLFVLGAPPVPLFLVLGIPLYLAMLVWIYKKGDGDVVKWTIVSIIIFYLTYNYVNPQYFYWILPFLILGGRRLATWLFTALPLIYVAFSYNIFYFVSPSLLFDQFSTGPSIVEQLKVTYFYTTPVQYILVSAAVPTLAYLYLLRRELRGKLVATPRPAAQTQDQSR